MTISEYFGDWMKVVDESEIARIMGWLKTVNPNLLCPSLSKVFKAFEICPYKECKVVMIFQDPYPQKGVATGIPVGNNPDTPEEKLSPSLKVLRESVIDFEIPHNIINFDNSLESWAKQGILMLNSALTCEMNRIGSHVNQWRPFISKLLSNLSYHNSGLVYVLFGRQAQTLKPYINEKYNDIIEIEHPAYYARVNQRMPGKIFVDINNIMYEKYGEKIQWFTEQED